MTEHRCPHVRTERRVDPLGPYRHCLDCREDFDYPIPGINLTAFYEAVEQR